MAADQIIALLGISGIVGGCVSLPACKVCTCRRLYRASQSLLVASLLLLGGATLWGATLGMPQSLTTGFLSGCLLIGSILVPCPLIHAS